MEGSRQWSSRRWWRTDRLHPPGALTSTPQPHPIRCCGRDPLALTTIALVLSLSYCVNMCVVIPQDGAASKRPEAVTVVVATEPQPTSLQDQPCTEQQRSGTPPRQPSSTQRQPSAGHQEPSTPRPQASSRQHQSRSQRLPSAMQQGPVASSVQPALTEEWLLAMEAKRQEQFQQQQEI
jgi:hypothetical protein